jgi:hypothetical protein
MRLIHVTIAIAILAAPVHSLPAAAPDIPALAWEKRSDWIDVKSDVTPAAVEWSARQAGECVTDTVSEQQPARTH